MAGAASASSPGVLQGSGRGRGPGSPGPLYLASPDFGSLALLSVLNTFLPKIPQEVLIFRTKPCLINLTKEGIPVPS